MKGKIVGGIVAVLAIIGIAGASSPQNQAKPKSTPVMPVSQQAAPTTTTQAPVTQEPTSTQQTVQPTTSTSTSSRTTTSSTTYTNSAGNTVQSPTYSTDGSVPSGATARCADGTYSFSQTRSGTCSHHGGVAKWL